MNTPYKLVDIRHTQEQGWVMDCFVNAQAVLPVSVSFDYHELYCPGFVFNSQRAEIKSLFEQRLAEQAKEQREEMKRLGVDEIVLRKQAGEEYQRILESCRPATMEDPAEEPETSEEEIFQLLLEKAKQDQLTKEAKNGR